VAIVSIAALALSLPAASAGAEALDPIAEVAPGVRIAPASDVEKGDPAPPSLPEAKRTADSRIVGGDTTTIAEWPWQVAITADPEFFAGDGFDRQFCGGTLVAPTIVVSAAHCFFDVLEGGHDFDPPDLFAAITGRTRLSSSAGQEIEVADYFVFVDDKNRELFNPRTFEWDVVFIQLASSSSQQTIKIAGPDEGAVWAAGRTAFITGWGTTSSGGSSSDFLREAQIEMIADSTCGSPSSYGSDFIAETMVCAGVLQGGKDTCQGDSGGPLVVPIAGEGFRLVGDTSFGIGCGLPNLPGVYGRLADDPIRTPLANGIQSVAGVNVLGSGAQPPDGGSPPPPDDGSPPPPPSGGATSTPTPTSPSNEFELGKLKGKKLKLTVPGAGEVEVRDAADANDGASAAKKKRKKLKPSRATATGPGKVTVKLRLKRRAKQKLRRRGKVKVKAAISFTPTGGTANTETEKLKIKKRK